MEDYLRSIVQCALSQLLLDKLSCTQDIVFSAEVSIIIDQTQKVQVLATDRVLKANALYYQEQFNLLTGGIPCTSLRADVCDVGIQSAPSHSSTQPSTPLVHHSAGTPPCQHSSSHMCDTGTQSSDHSKWNLVDAESQTDLVKEPSAYSLDKEFPDIQIADEKSQSDTHVNLEDKGDRNEIVMVHAEVQTEETKLKMESKKRPRKASTQQRKSKKINVQDLKDLSIDLVPVDIKQEFTEDARQPVSDPGSDVEEVTVVPALPPSDTPLVKNNNEQITCPLCPAKFRSQQGAETHLRVQHDIGNVYVCNLCQEVCPSNNALTQHNLDAHGIINSDTEEVNTKRKRRSRKVALKSTKVSSLQRKTGRVIKQGSKNLSFVIKTTNTKPKPKSKVKITQKCPDCPKEYTSKRALTRHIKSFHEAKRHQCDICGKCFTSTETLYHHRRGIHSESKPYQCDECGASFNFNHSLRLHRLKHSGIRPYECSVCHKTYLTANHLKMHMQGVHNEKKGHSCHICGKAFSYTTSLKVHIMTHGDVRPYKCNVCGQGFINSHSLKYHRESKHSSNTWFDCDVCGKKYKTEFLMKTHRRRHTPDGQRYMCDICGRQFMYKSTLEIHAAVHSDEKSFQCTQCGKSFKTYATLYSHQYVHKADSPFKCPECGKAFKTKERCKAHQRRHSGLKPFECELCGRCFPDKGGLSKHTKTVHCDVKKFVCDVCGKACSRGDNLRVHMKIHSKVSEGGGPNISPPKRSKVQTVSNDLDESVALAVKSVYVQGRDSITIPSQSSTPGADSMLTNISSPNISPPPSMAPLHRAYQERIEPPPFIPNADSISIPSALNLHAVPLTSHETDMNSIHSNPVTMHPGNSNTPMIPSSLTQMPSVSSYMYPMWPYLHPSANQQANDNGNPYY